jgi:hypothetical protein
MIGNYFANLCTTAGSLRDYDDYAEIAHANETSLLIHVLARLFAHDYCSESFDTLSDTHCREKIVYHYDELYKTHLVKDHNLIFHLKEFVKLESHFEQFVDEVAEELILQMFVEDTVIGIPFDLESFIERVEKLRDKTQLIMDAAECFCITENMAKSLFTEFKNMDDNFHAIYWTRWMAELEDLLEEFKIENV